MNIIFNRIFFTLYSALFLATPLIMFSKTSELFEFNKLLFIYFIALSVLCTWLAKMILSKKIILKKTILDIPILLFLISQIISTLFSIDPHTSVFGYYGRFNGGLLSFFSYMVLFYGFVTNIDKKYIHWLLSIILISGIGVFLWGIPGKFGHDLSCLVFSGTFDNSCWTAQFRPAERIFSTLGQPNWLGAYFSVLFFLSLYFIFRRDPIATLRNDKVKISSIQHLVSRIYPLLPPLFFLGILFTRSRSALVATGIGFVLYVGHFIIRFLTDKKFKTNLLEYKKIIGGIFLGMLVAILLFKTGIPQIDKLITFSKASSAPVEKINPLTELPVAPASNVAAGTQRGEPTNITESFDIRKIVWNGAIQLGKKYPLFGTGVETFAYSYNLVRPQEHNLTSEWDYIYNKAHNEYLNYFATTGFTGLLIYGVFIGMVLIFLGFQLFKKKPENEMLILSILTAWISILVSNFFGFSTTTINLFFYLLPGMIIVSLLNNSEEDAKKKIVHNRYFLIIPIVIFIGGCVYLINYLRADIAYASGNSLYQVKDYANAYQYLFHADSLKNDHVYEDRLASTLANLAILELYQTNGNKQEIQQQLNTLYKLSDYYSQLALSGSSKNPYYYRNRAKNYYIFYTLTTKDADYQKAIQAIQKAESLAPTDPKNYYTEGLLYLLRWDDKKEEQKELKAKIEEVINRSLILKPDYRDSRFSIAQFYKKIGDIEKAKIQLTILVKQNPLDTEAKKELKGL